VAAESNSKRTGIVVMLALSGLALTVRLVIVWMYARTTPILNFFLFGYEPSHIAAALVNGQGFSSAFSVHSGPTAWIPPMYPWTIALAFKLFGVFSGGALWFLLGLNLIFATATTATIYRIGQRCFTPDVAFGGALLWAVSPDAVAMAVRIWDIGPATLLAALVVLWYLRIIQSDPGWKDWIVYGVLWGLSALVSTTLLAMLPLPFLVLFLRQHGRFRKQIVAAFAIVILTMTPWTIRNYVRFGRLIPIRGNFGAELWAGNHPGVQGPADESVHPLKDKSELDAYEQMGEAGYVASRQRMANAFIRGNPKQFVELSWERFISFWSAPLVMSSAWPAACAVLGWAAMILLWWRKESRPLVTPFAAVILFFPASYYLSHAESYFRSPVEPLISLLAVRAFFQCIELVSPHSAAASADSPLSAAK